MGIASLMGAADDHIQLLPCQIAPGLIKIEVIADQKAETNALNFDHRGLGVFKRIIAVQGGIAHLAQCQMLLVVHTYDVTAAVKGISGVPQSCCVLTSGIDKQNGITPLCSFGCSTEQSFIKLLYAQQPLFLGLCQAGSICRFRHHNDIHRIITLRHKGKLLFE